MAEQLKVEVAFALPEKQHLELVLMTSGATVADAIEAARLERFFPNQDFEILETGIWGRPVSRSEMLSAGDRVELYRPLEMDPREARRQLAMVGQTMSRSADD